jgi:hypothetical protein
MTQNTPVCCAVWCHNRLENILSKQVFMALQAVSTVIGSTCQGFEQSKICTHSHRSGAAMEMYLAGVPVYTIMLIGRWSSDALLCCIRKQVEQYSQNVVNQMLMFRSF